MKANKNLYRLFIFAITFFGYSMLHAMRSSWSYSKNQMIKEGKMTKVQSGYVDMTFMLCYSLGLSVIGPLGDVINRRYFLSIGYMICSLAFLVYPFSCQVFNESNIIILFVFMAINGLFQSVGMPGSMGVLHNWFSKKNRGGVVGFWAGCCNYGNIFGFISSTIINQNLNLVWEYNFFFNGILSFCMGLLILIFLIPQPDNKQSFLTQYSTESFIQIQKSAPMSQTSSNTTLEFKKKLNFFTCFLIPRVPSYVIAYTCLKSSIYGLLFWLPRYVLSKDIQATGYIPSMNDVGTFVGGAVIGYLGDKFPRTYFLAPMMYFSAAMMLIIKFALAGDALPYYFMVFLMGLGLGGPYNIIGTVISIDLGTDKSLKGDKQAISTVTGVIDGTGAFFSAITQLVLGYIPTDKIFYLFAAYTLLGAISLTPLLIEDFTNRKIEEYTPNQKLLTKTEGQ